MFCSFIPLSEKYKVRKPIIMSKKRARLHMQSAVVFRQISKVFVARDSGAATAKRKLLSSSKFSLELFSYAEIYYFDFI